MLSSREGSPPSLPPCCPSGSPGDSLSCSVPWLLHTQGLVQQHTQVLLCALCCFALGLHRCRGCFFPGGFSPWMEFITFPSVHCSTSQPPLVPTISATAFLFLPQAPGDCVGIKQSFVVSGLGEPSGGLGAGPVSRLRLAPQGLVLPQFELLQGQRGPRFVGHLGDCPHPELLFQPAVSGWMLSWHQLLDLITH